MCPLSVYSGSLTRGGNKKIQAGKTVEAKTLLFKGNLECFQAFTGICITMEKIMSCFHTWCYLLD